MKYIALAILSVAILSVVLGYVHAFGDDGWSTDCNKSISYTICNGLHQLYNNQQILIQEQEQANHLSEYKMCGWSAYYSGISTTNFYDDYQNMSVFHKYVSALDNDTK